MTDLQPQIDNPEAPKPNGSLERSLEEKEETKPETSCEENKNVLGPGAIPVYIHQEQGGWWRLTVFGREVGGYDNVSLAKVHFQGWSDAFRERDEWIQGAILKERDALRAEVRRNEQKLAELVPSGFAGPSGKPVHHLDAPATIALKRELAHAQKTVSEAGLLLGDCKEELAKALAERDEARADVEASKAFCRGAEELRAIAERARGDMGDALHEAEKRVCDLENRAQGLEKILSARGFLVSHLPGEGTVFELAAKAIDSYEKERQRHRGFVCSLPGLRSVERQLVQSLQATLAERDGLARRLDVEHEMVKQLEAKLAAHLCIVASCASSTTVSEGECYQCCLPEGHDGSHQELKDGKVTCLWTDAAVRWRATQPTGFDVEVVHLEHEVVDVWDVRVNKKHALYARNEKEAWRFESAIKMAFEAFTSEKAVTP